MQELDRTKIPSQLRIDTLSQKGLVRTQWTTLICMMWVWAWALANAASLGMYIIPFVTTEWGLTPLMIGLIMSAKGLGDAIVGLTGGIMAEYLGRRWCILIHQLVLGVGLLMAAVGPNYYWYAAAVVISSYGLSGNHQTLQVYAAEYAPSRVRGRVAYAMMMMPGGILVSYFGVWGLTIGWRACVWILVVLVFTSAVCIIGISESARWLQSRGRWSEADKILSRLEAQSKVPPIQPDAAEIYKLPEKEKISYFELFRSGYWKRTFPLWAAWLGHYFGMRTVEYWMPTLLRTPLGPKLAADFMFYLSFTGPIFYLIFIVVIDRFQRRTLLAAGLFIQAVCFFIFPWYTNLWYMVVVYIIFKFVYPWHLILWPITSEVYPTRVRALGFGAAAGIGKSAGIWGGVVVGLVIAQFGYIGAFVWGAMALCIQGVSALCLPRKTTGQAVEQIAK